MSLTLYIAKEWEEHVRQVLALYPSCWPVLKGSGYGFGIALLAATAHTLGQTHLAVGTVEEARLIRPEQAFAEILVLVPTMSPLQAVDLAGDLLFTVGHERHLEHLVRSARQLGAGVRSAKPLPIVIKGQTSMRRFGWSLAEVRQLQSVLGEFQRAYPLDVRGFSIHLPRTQVDDGAAAEVEIWARELTVADWAAKTLWVSHLSAERYHDLASRFPEIRLVMRMGSDLWQHDPCLYARSTVLAVQEIAKGQTYGYGQKQARRAMRLVHVSGGTANGIGLEPQVRRGGLREGLGQVFKGQDLLPSPFYYQGERLPFAEPPHMQVSILSLPEGMSCPQIGNELAVAVRMSMTRFDQVRLLG